jgi:uncharacterized protein with ParB-like and HNH nuclease domain
VTDNEKRAIQGLAKNVRTLLSGQKYTIDFYQREFKWTTKQVSELVVDLTTRFLEDHEDNDDKPREIVSTYGHYFLGSIVICNKNGEKFIIDGQQRLTSLTLLLIYLNNLQKEREDRVNVSELIFSTKYGKRSFNLDIPERTSAMDALYKQEQFEIAEAAESVRNVIDRYQDVCDLFPAEIKDETLPFFVDWLMENVYLVEITAFTDEEAYTIFETMNDRGLSLSPTDMLKGYLLSNITNQEKRDLAHTTWKTRTDELLDYGDDETASFFKAWLRSQYADSIRERAKNAVARDFDLLGTQFHRWIRDNYNRVKLNRSIDYENFILRDLDFYVQRYREILYYSNETYKEPFEDLYHISKLGFTLQYPTLLAPLDPVDAPDQITIKLRLVAAYLDILLARRLWNWRSISYSTLQYNIFLLIKDIRRKAPEALLDILIKRLADPETGSFSGNMDFGMHKMNRYMVHQLLARMTVIVEKGSKYPNHYLEYVNETSDPKNPYEVEHVWANIASRFEAEFPQQHDFERVRNQIGSLLLLPKKFNASYNDKTYERKVGPYFHQNLLAASLNEQSYSDNPGFRKFISKTGLPFNPYAHFKKADQEERQELYVQLAEYTWRVDRLREIIEKR